MLVAGSSLDHHLAVLRAVHGVTAVKDFGVEGNRSKKQFGVNLCLRTAPGADGVQRIRVACNADVPTKVVSESRIVCQIATEVRTATPAHRFRELKIVLKLR